MVPTKPRPRPLCCAAALILVVAGPDGQALAAALSVTAKASPAPAARLGATPVPMLGSPAVEYLAAPAPDLAPDIPLGEASFVVPDPEVRPAVPMSLARTIPAPRPASAVLDEVFQASQGILAPEEAWTEESPVSALRTSWDGAIRRSAWRSAKSVRWLQRLAALAPAAFTAVAAAFLTAYSWAVKADEFMADAGAAALTGEPRALVSALKKTGAIAGGELVLP